jgi:competence protein ComEC
VRTPAAIAAIPFLAGSALGLCLWEHLPGSFAFCSASAALIALTAAAGAIGLGLTGEAVVALAVGLMLAGSSLGQSAATRAYRPPLLIWFESENTTTPKLLEGLLREDAAVTPFGPSLTIDVLGVDRNRLGAKAGATGVSSLGGVRLSVGGSLAASKVSEWRAGRLVRVTATLRYPVVYRDPGVRDERRALARRGVILVGSIKSAALVEVVARGSVASEAAASVRAWTRATLAAAIGSWRPRSAAIAAAILIGDRSGLSEDDSRRLQEAGTYHVIAISGGNIAILTVLLLAITRTLRLTPGTAAATAIAGLGCYSLIVISSPSVERAIAASVLYLSGRLIDHRPPALNTLGVAAVLGAAAAPATLLDPGFVLSFGATLAILVCIGLIPRPAGTQTALQRLVRAAGVLLLTTVATEIALLPANAVFFSRVTFAGLLLNFAAIPLMAVLQLTALAVLFTQPLRNVQALCALLAHLSADGLIESARLVEYAPWLSRGVVMPAGWLIVSYYVAIVAACVLRSRRRGARARRTTALAIASAANVAVLILIGPRWVSAARVTSQHHPLRIVFLDVGQGDATVLLLPGNRALLVDAGGIPAAQPIDPASDSGPAFDIGDRVLTPALRALGVRSLDTLLMTHGDPDHIGGALSVMRTFHPRAIWEGIPVPPHPGLRAIAFSADATAASRRELQAGDVERFGPVEVRVLHPPKPEWERQRVRNEDSVVLDLRIGDVSVILPGDVGREGERAMLPRLERSRIVVLKAPHHGSATSSTPELLDALRPAAVVFSAGRANRFGHPHPAVVARYRALGAQIFSTADDGAVIVDTDGKTVEMKGWLGRSITLGDVR